MLRAVCSLAALAVLALVFTGVDVVVQLNHPTIPAVSEGWWALLTRTFLACWVYVDRKNRRLMLPFEFEAFVFFAWPFALPYYLYKSRGAGRGVLVTVFIFGVMLLPPIVDAFLAVALRLV